LTLSVRDDGKGIDEKSINTPTSLGLIGVRERVLPSAAQLKCAVCKRVARKCLYRFRRGNIEASRNANSNC